MLRECLKFLIALLLGCVAAVLLAVAACLWPVATWSAVVSDEEARRRLNDVSEHLDWGSMINSEPNSYDAVKCEVVHGLGFTEWVFTFQKVYPRKKVDGRDIQWTASTTGSAGEYGWPLRCFIADNVALVAQKAPSAPATRLQTAQQIASRSRPLLAGLLINVLILAAAIRFVPGLLRRIRAMHRVRRGRCAACGYPRGSSSVCTECGTPLPRLRTS